MCTVVVRWSRAEPVLVLALRDELVGRAFDEPAAWWPESPGTVGGRDRQAGGTWCATDVASGRTALVLNRPQRPLSAAGAPSRGVLPLLAARLGERWADALDVAGMASFALVLAGPDALVLWEHDGERVTSRRLPEGVHVVTSGGAEDRKADRHLAAFLDDVSPLAWQRVVTGSEVADDPTSLLVRHEREGAVFATVFGQVVESEPGSLRLTWSRTPERDGWSSGSWPRGTDEPLPG